jgi:hypothetical protein
MDPINSSPPRNYTPPPSDCPDTTVNAVGAGLGCAGSLILLVGTSPTGIALLGTSVAAAGACGLTGWTSARAVDHCSREEPAQGMGPQSGQDGVEDHRNDPATARWRSGVVVEPLDRSADAQVDAAQDYKISSEDQTWEGWSEHQDSSFQVR